MVTESASSQSSNDTEENNPNLLKYGKNNSQETNQGNESEVIDNRTPVFIPDQNPYRYRGKDQ